MTQPTSPNAEPRALHPAIQLSAAWSPGGRSIAISRVSDENNTGIYLLPPTGGPERKPASRSNVISGGKEIDWSPDGQYLACRDQPENPKSLVMEKTRL